MSGIGENAWLFITKSDLEVYEDVVSEYYSYDDNVPNHKKVRVGDLVVIREDDYIAGWAVIERLEAVPNQIKELHRCPNCLSTGPNFRVKFGTYRCSNRNCKFEFAPDRLMVTRETVTQFRAHYAGTWQEGARHIDYHDVEPLTVIGGQLSIRPLDVTKLSAFLDRLTGRDVNLKVDFPEQQVSEILGGHSSVTVRRRRGQRKFRFAMLDRYGERCAFTGTQPPQVLEAAHLYSFAKNPVHSHDGGILLRRDCHSLFDANLLTIDPATFRIEVAPMLEAYSTYAPLKGKELLIQAESLPSTELLQAHYEKSLLVFSHN